MMYKFLTLDDQTEIVYSELLPDGSVKVYVEKPDAQDCFHHMTCYLPSYKIEECFGFSQQEQERYMKVIKSTAHLMMEKATENCN